MLDYILDWIYPPRCMVCSGIIAIEAPRWLCERCVGILEIIEPQSICDKCGRPLEEGNRTCGSCAGKDFLFERNRALYEYDEIMSFLIHKLKYGGHSGLGHGLGTLMAANINEENISQVDYLIPVPMYHKKERERGFNQASLMSHEISKRTNKKTLDKLLLRTRNTKAQRFLNRSEREKNIQGAFSVNRRQRHLVAGKNFMVIDDIYTTGSTLNACAQALKKSGADKVIGYTLSIAMKKEKNYI